MSDWHGWGIKGKVENLHIGPLPGRKGIAFYVLREATVSPLAYFVSEERAREALALIDRIFERRMAP